MTTPESTYTKPRPAPLGMAVMESWRAKFSVISNTNSIFGSVFDELPWNGVMLRSAMGTPSI